MAAAIVARLPATDPETCSIFGALTFVLPAPATALTAPATSAAASSATTTVTAPRPALRPILDDPSADSLPSPGSLATPNASTIGTWSCTRAR